MSYRIVGNAVIATVRLDALLAERAAAKGRIARLEAALDAILTSDIDEALMRSTLLRCYGARHHGFHVSVEHYRYLAEQIIALRVHIKRAAAAALADAPEEGT